MCGQRTAEQWSYTVGPKPRATVTSRGSEGSADSGTRIVGHCNQSGQRIISRAAWDPSSGVPLSRASS
jgi:hypothetical protein